MATTIASLLDAVKVIVAAITDGAGARVFKRVAIVPAQSIDAALRIPALPVALIVESGGELVAHARGALWDGSFVITAIAARPKDALGEQSTKDALDAIDELADNLSYSVADALWVSASGAANEFDLPDLAIPGAGGVASEPLQVVSRSLSFDYSLRRS